MENYNKKWKEFLNENLGETSIIKKGTKFKNDSNGKILTIVKDFEITLPLPKEERRKMIYVYSPEFESGYNPSGVERIAKSSLFTGGFTQMDESLNENLGDNKDVFSIISHLQEASKIAEKNIDLADNFDVVGFLDALDDYIQQLENIGNFETYPEEREAS